MNQFTESFKNLANIELVKILNNANDYQIEAVEAAKLEIEDRNLSTQDIANINENITHQKEKKLIQSEYYKSTITRFSSLTSKFFEAINPIQKNTPTQEKLIRFITIVFGFIVCATWIQEFYMIHYFLTDGFGKWDSSILEYFIILILLPLALINFWKKDKIGWILLAIFITYSLATKITVILLLWNTPRIFLLNDLYPKNYATVLNIIFLLGILWVLLKEKIRMIYHITKFSALLTLFISSIFSILFINLILDR
jgi:hypothetical protein